MTNTRPTILFLCTGNSCRSQMAEGWARALHCERFDVHSAGIEAQGLNPHAIEVMREAGVDISQQSSERLEDLQKVVPDLVITVCSHADENCPVLPGKCRKLHVPFDDPPALARNAASEAERLGHYRRVRDEIREFVRNLPKVLAPKQ
jgi:arsenate reductase